MARPTKYDPAMCETVFHLCLLGATDEELAAALDVDVATVQRWKLKHPAFCDSIKRGKVEADGRVAASLYDKALTGDTTACIFWLKNRQKGNWRDKQETEITGKDGGPLKTSLEITFIKPDGN